MRLSWSRIEFEVRLSHAGAAIVDLDSMGLGQIQQGDVLIGIGDPPAHRHDRRPLLPGAMNSRVYFPEIDALSPEENVTRLVWCSGKIDYELLEERSRRGIDRVALVRVEQL